MTIAAYRRAQRLLFPLMTLVGEDAELGAAGALAFLTANFGYALGLVVGLSFDRRLDLVQQQSSSQITVQRLGALFLAPDPNAGRSVVQQHAARNLVDVLAARARGADELFVDVLLAHGERLHALEQLFFLAG